MKSLNIKDEEVHRLAEAIARETGESMTSAVREALRERYDRVVSRKRKARAAELRAIAKKISSLVRRPYMDHAELLYGEDGLPK